MRVRPCEPCIARREQILAEACRILRPGGSLSILEMDPSAPGYIKLRKNPVSVRVAVVVGCADLRVSMHHYMRRRAARSLRHVSATFECACTSFPGGVRAPPGTVERLLFYGL